MRLFDLFGRSRPRCAPRPCSNRVRCAVELLESRLVLSSTDTVSTVPIAVAPQPAPTDPVMTAPPAVAPQPAPSSTDTTLTAPTTDTTSITTTNWTIDPSTLTTVAPSS